MPLDTFRNSLLKSDMVLKHYGINLYDLIMTGEETAFEETLNSFVGIAAIQVHVIAIYLVLK